MVLRLVASFVVLLSLAWLPVAQADDVIRSAKSGAWSAGDSWTGGKASSGRESYLPQS
jgi:hypothetical protein